MPEAPSESEALREHWLERKAAVQALLEEDRAIEAAETLADVVELPSDPETRVIAGEVYGLLNPTAGLEILNVILEEVPDLQEAARAKKVIEDTIHEASASDRSQWVRILTPGERARRKIERANQLMAFALGIGGTAAIVALMLLINTPVPPPEPPKIVAIAPPDLPDDPIDDPQMKKFEKIPVPSAPKAGEMSSQIITAAAVSEIASISVDSIGDGLGMANFGNSFGSSMNFGVQGGASAMFFGSKSEGKRFLFVLDASRSMTTSQVKLRNDELQRALSGIRGAQYQVLLFAGGAFFAEKGWGIDPSKPSGSHGPTHFVSPHGDYHFTSKSIYDFNLAGPDSDFTPAEWKRANTLNIRRSVEMVRESKLFTGTDWDMALQLGHMMKPPPDVIFFMSDGLDSEISVSNILRNARRNGNPKINMVAMQTSSGAQNFADIAKGTKGAYTIVTAEGEILDGFEKPDL